MKPNGEPFGITTCSAGKNELIVGNNGEVYPCPSYMNENFSMGNLLNFKKISDMLKADTNDYVCEHVGKIHPANLEECLNCNVKLFCWTCPGEFRDIKTKKAFQKRCAITKPMLQERVWESKIMY
ncbi:hypothetical protein AZF37_01665 [endosymbiont 'TC1' of Trimyema compressum]|uniref:SPASM domain-containing protein n=1 Tax=endosymbiont 'TC1' of Trimyema compressum TaxID=243899 RepID=UPI0007F13756|nr:SPASM domain-containing protein [endosymbiont 'TC1' of Trimyema compressum]AMP20052.1 hypothetical protein AZF37_01665 [endosymbiont 'TC1' of Trimyema compressum]